MLQHALRYRDMGLSVIPVRSNSKIPATKWLEYQSRLPSVDEINQWWGREDYNIGIVTGAVSGIMVIDCDSPSAITAFLELYKGDAPRVRTPRGMHFFFKYEEGMQNSVRVAGYDLDIRADGGYVVAPPSIINNRLYEFIKPIESISIIPNIDSNIINALSINNALITNNNINNNIYNARAREANIVPFNKNNHNQSHESQTVTDYFIKGRRDEDIFHAANCLVKGGAKVDFIRQALKMLAFSCNPPFPENEIEAKVSSAIERGKRKDRNIMAEIKEWLESQTGHFRVTDYHNESHLVTKQEKHAANVAFTRLCEQGILERHGDRSGTYRKVENDVEVIDWKNAVTEEYPIKFPLNVHHLVKLYPGNIAILAGATNTGKTTFMLELVRLNQFTHNVLYMNSEMGASELKLRLEMFKDVCPLEKWKFKAIERSDKFADAIDPDGLNVIDFMEIYDEFWKLGGWIRDVHKKLNKGVAIIAIQKQSSTKKDQKDFGRGGEMTLEKPRLYMAMDRGRLKIVKAKIWRRHDRNPNGLSRSFKIVSGWKFLPNDEWRDEKEGQYPTSGAGYEVSE